MKKITAVLLSMLMVLSVFCACGKVEEKDTKNGVAMFEDVKLADGVVAIVNDTEITVDEVKFYLSQYCESVYSQNGMASATKEEKENFWNQEKDGVVLKDDFYNSALDAYVGLASMVNLATEKGITLTDEEFNESIAQEGIGEAIEHYKTTYNISEDAIKEYLKKQLIYEKYAVEYIETDERMNISDDKLKEKFKEDYIKAQHILKMTVDETSRQPLTEDKIKEAKANIEKVLEDVKKPDADFKVVMLEQSEDPGSKQQPDGYVFKEGEMVTEFYETAKALKENEISDVVETSYGYHIIKRLPLDMDADFETARGSIENEVKTEIFQNILTESKDKMKIKADYKQLYAIEGILY